MTMLFGMMSSHSYPSIILPGRAQLNRQQYKADACGRRHRSQLQFGSMLTELWFVIIFPHMPVSTVPTSILKQLPIHKQLTQTLHRLWHVQFVAFSATFGPSLFSSVSTVRTLTLALLFGSSFNDLLFVIISSRIYSSHPVFGQLVQTQAQAMADSILRHPQKPPVCPHLFPYPQFPPQSNKPLTETQV